MPFVPFDERLHTTLGCYPCYNPGMIDRQSLLGQFETSRGFNIVFGAVCVIVFLAFLAFAVAAINHTMRDK